MSDEEIDEPDLIKALFDELRRQPYKAFRRGCPDVPNEDGVYVIYGAFPTQVLYVGRTYRAARRRHPFNWWGLRRRLSAHRSKYTPPQHSYHCSFQCLIVTDPRHRALLEAYATGVLCPADVGTAYRPSVFEQWRLENEEPQSK